MSKVKETQPAQVALLFVRNNFSATFIWVHESSGNACTVAQRVSALDLIGWLKYTPRSSGITLGDYCWVLAVNRACVTPGTKSNGDSRDGHSKTRGGDSEFIPGVVSGWTPARISASQKHVQDICCFFFLFLFCIPFFFFALCEVNLIDFKYMYI